MFCEKCGNKLLEGDRFCPVCGNLVETQGPFSEHPSADEQELDMTAGMGYGYPEPEKQPFENRKEEERTGSHRPSGKPSNKKKRQQEEEEEWEREERKEKITFMILGVVIVALIIVITAGIIFLLNSDGARENKREPQLTEEQKDELLHKNQQETTPEPTQEPSPEPTEEETEETTPQPTQEVTPQPTQEVTPVPTQKAAPPTQPVTPIPTEIPETVLEEDYIISDSSTRYLTNADLNALSEAEIRIARNEIYARHGRTFKSEDLAEYFGSKSWYVPSVPADQFDNSYLNAIEVENLKFITNYEKAHNMNQ